MTTPLRREISLACTQERAFKIFTEMTNAWWPREHRRTSDATLILEPHTGGRLFERATDDSEWTMARITKFEPPHTLELDWFPGSPQAPTHVNICFTDLGDTTQLVITHTPLTDAARAIWGKKLHLFVAGWEAVLHAIHTQIPPDK